ncbi:SDR family oxidoreductase [Hoeflea sp. WL0058]|uniref:SDR family oxidoreductase n=1 Tax=Flavimaribacter sediminis TaxID=2865987 RepID=A0AAE2ZU83_9HYPH|nr:SDR family oxidoreductase [Flavimaribacter sediminis]MBW8640690.1 SDR family oxidoreductase [Flavimaribacter sediminis]
MRTVIITGAAGGIGRALLEQFAETGARLIGVDLPNSGVAAAVAACGEGHIALECDQSDEEQVTAMFARIDEVCERVDVLVNNAARAPTMAATVDTDLAGFQATIRTNLSGPFVLAREAVKRMQPGGVIVNTASLAGVVSNPCRNAYAASKAALISLTKSLACEWASRGLRVCAIAPGYVLTPMVAALEAEGKADLSAVRRRVPLGRLGRPDEMASAVVFLASDAARYITGSVLAVDGGWGSFNQPGHAHPPVDGQPGAETATPVLSESKRVTVITGAARGIGAAIARRFSAAGDQVVLIDRDSPEPIALELDNHALALQADISSESDVTQAFERIRDRFGRIDVMINNAAIADEFKPALEQSAADLERVLDINLTGTFLCARAAIPLMDSSGGVLINLGSINTFLPFAPRHAYGASKAGVDIFTRCLAAELGPKGIRSATLAPGYIRTPGVAALEQAGRIDSNAIRKRIPMGDFGRPEDVADAAWFLASPSASYVNGGILYVDGGWTSFGNAGNASDPEVADA